LEDTYDILIDGINVEVINGVNVMSDGKLKNLMRVGRKSPDKLTGTGLKGHRADILRFI
jgi:hypothetical protein